MWSRTIIYILTWAMYAVDVGARVWVCVRALRGPWVGLFLVPLPTCKKLRAGLRLVLSHEAEIKAVRLNEISSGWAP